MFTRIDLNTFEDYFVPCSGRGQKVAYFCRLTKYSEQIHQFICQYIEVTRKSGVCISGHIGNPDEGQLNYYDEMMGRDYELNPNFFAQSLKKWLPRVREVQRTDIANSYYDIFTEMGRSGKNENIQRNAYIKFMCWLYYKFEPILQQLGCDHLPKVLFEGSVNMYELKLLSILSKAGCDILLLELAGDEPYLQVDPKSEYSELLDQPGGGFPANYSVIELRKQLANQPQTNIRTVQGTAASMLEQGRANRLVTAVALKEFKTDKIINTNTWLKGDPFTDILLTQQQRGTDSKFYYNLFSGVYGVENPSSYYSNLLKWKIKLETAGKALILLEETISPPTFEEISSVQRKNYQTSVEVLNDMVLQLRCMDKRLQNYCQHAFMQLLKEPIGQSVQKLLNISVIMVCWMNRLSKWIAAAKEKSPVIVFYGELKGANEIFFLRILSRLPVDVLILDPQNNSGTEITDKLFYAKKCLLTMTREPFPQSLSGVQFGTAAYRAEQDLNTIMYQDTGVYRNQQFKSAMPVLLQITYEEIAILWNQEAKYRPNFETFDDRVMVPVMFSKVCGIPKTINAYWEEIAELVIKDIFIIKDLPYANKTANPFKDKAYQFINNGKLDIRRMKAHQDYPFSFIREAMQDFMLAKLQEMIDQKTIVGTGVSGMENLIIATVFHMDKQLLRLIQNYDFAKQIPKVLVIHTKDSSSSHEDSILLAYLNMVGFDIVMYVPTGYANIERYYTRQLFVEHQIGEYKYDLQIPDLYLLKKKGEGLGRLFRRGR